jgi:enoyl-CoA hydratase
MAKTIAAKSSLGVQFSKKSVNEGVNLDLDQALSLETELFGCLFSTKDQAEGMSAFLEKRQPFFIGK